MTDPTGSWEQAVLALRADPTRQSLVRDGYYDDPLVDAANRYWRSDEWRSIAQILPRSPGRALDVGAGRGIASYALARTGFDVTALEPDPSAVVGAGAIRTLAREAALTIDVVQEHSERLPFVDGIFDLVFARAVLHHMRDLGAACREFARVLKPGGRLVAVREHVISRPDHLQAFLDHHPLHRLYGGEHAYLLSQYVSAIESAGLRLRSVVAPLESPINFAPHTEVSLRAEVASRAGRRLPGGASWLRGFLARDAVWRPTRWLLGKIDDRPGRLYSFVAHKA